MTRLALLLLVVAAFCSAADLGQIRAEPDLGKRSAKALDNAFDELKGARAAYSKGDHADFAAHLDAMGESVDLAWQSLQATGKDPRRSPKWFKRAEIATRDIERRLEALQREMDYSDRPAVEPLKTRVQRVHETLLTELMEGKRK